MSSTREVTLFFLLIGNVYSLHLSNNLLIKFSNHFYPSNSLNVSILVSMISFTMRTKYLYDEQVSFPPSSGSLFFQNLYSPVFNIPLLYSWIFNKYSYHLLNPSPESLILDLYKTNLQSLDLQFHLIQNEIYYVTH